MENLLRFINLYLCRAKSCKIDLCMRKCDKPIKDMKKVYKLA